MPATDREREFYISSSLGKDALLFERMHSIEQMNTAGSHELYVLTESSSLDVFSLLGKSLTVHVELSNGSHRYFHAYVINVVATGRRDRFYSYHLQLSSWFHFLKLNQASRIFQNQTLECILQSVFAKYDEYVFSVSYKAQALKKQLSYCVQYAESDFDFVSRLMEKMGIAYFFKHDQAAHHLVICDESSAFLEKDLCRKLQLVAPGAALTTDCVWDWCSQQNIQAGAVAIQDYDFEKASPSTQGRLFSRRLSQSKTLDSKHEQFVYPGLFTEVDVGDFLAVRGLELLETHAQGFSAETTSRVLSPGLLFNLQGHWEAELNQQYLVLETSHTLISSFWTAATTPVLSWQCQLRGISSRVPFRPAKKTPWPVMRGPQTAMVVGKTGEEIWTDQYGQVKVKFQWDRDQASDERSSCWLRVAQSLAGNRWGTTFIPRVGQEVVVDFLDGDPDRPLVTGVVYNAANRPPVSLPTQASRSVIKTNSSKGGYGFNLIRFEDKKGEEQLLFRAEKDKHDYIKHELREWIGGDRHTLIKGKVASKIGGNASLVVGGGFSQKTTKNHVVQADGNITVSGGKNLLIEAKDGLSLDSAQLVMEAGNLLSLKSKRIVLEAQTMLTLKVGGNSIVLSESGVAIDGRMLQLNGGASAPGSPGVKVAAVRVALEEPLEAEDGNE
ncbi:type VI secretion system Vgr family protein [Chromobacterium haemolyticum]|uniref:Uncharacterized protein n=1 Tax=Chromobacterium haemolyticum TaxID=394935 RepID=A0A1W0CDX9_9NEIS|nr:type VI secretion system tip protein TssI/VgrG [Chromobacterium haemolyticum]OQS32958.1 hypothetical protein B0T45_21010 [Chromobacterium haemolyticum]